MRKVLALALAAALYGTTALAQDDFKPAIIFDMGGKMDKSFNEAAFNGAERFKEETGIDYLEFEITNEAQREQAMERMIRSGADIIAVVGFQNATPLEAIAKDNPEVKFTIVDAVVDLPNVQSVTFKEHEGSYLVGMAAALASKTDTVGFVGGMDIPLIRNFQHGYEQGVKAVNPDAQVIANMAGTTPAAWSDPARGAELAISQFDRGADVVYAAAGATGLGVLQAAADADKLAIGVDSNQNYLYPGHILTSMVKRVDEAIYNTFMTAKNGDWEPGAESLGLAENGVGYALDENNADLVTPEMKEKIEAAKQEIIDGKVSVESYYSTQN